MSLTWGAIAGTTTIIPYFYPAFFIAVLVHRVGRDFERSVLNFWPIVLTNVIVDARSSTEKTGSDIALSSNINLSLAFIRVHHLTYILFQPMW